MKNIQTLRKVEIINFLKVTCIKFSPSILILLLVSFTSNLLTAQSMGISSSIITPDPSSILELRTNSKGILIPRMTTQERDGISSPANGLMIYNGITKKFNFYNGTLWVVLGSTPFLSVDAGSTLSTESNIDVVIPGMSKAIAETGTYLALFNGQASIAASVYTTGFSTANAKADLSAIYTDLINIPVTNTTHPLSFGEGETILPGVYSLAGAIAISGALTLDANNDPNAVFVIRSNAALDAAVNTIITLKNGASSSNIYWVAEGAVGIGAGCTMPGTILSNSGAVAVGANCTVSGRFLTKAGAIGFGASGNLSVPTTTTSFINFRRLTNFVIFTSGGGVSSGADSNYNGDIGTNLGEITGFGAAASVNGTIFEAGSTTVVTPVNHIATFSFYKNGVLIPNSSRTRNHLSNSADVSLQSLTTASEGDTIEVKWNIDAQASDSKQLKINNRILTLVKVGN
jgi:hypothetical protein